MAAFVTGVFTMGTSWFGAHEAANQRLQQAEARSVDLQAQQFKAYYDARIAACKVAGDWYMDESPNPSLPKAAQQLLIEDMRERLRSCDISPPSRGTTIPQSTSESSIDAAIERVASPSDNTASKPQASSGANGGHSTGGGYTNAF